MYIYPSPSILKICTVTGAEFFPPYVNHEPCRKTFLVLGVEPQLDDVVDGDVRLVQLQVDGLGHVEHVPRPVGLMLLLLLVMVPAPPSALGGGPVGLGIDVLPRRQIRQLPELVVVGVDVPDEAGAAGEEPAGEGEEGADARHDRGHDQCDGQLDAQDRLTKMSYKVKCQKGERVN